VNPGTRGSIEPTCPFCSSKLERPKTIVLNVMESVQGGTCVGCNSIYIVDQTGKNLGEAMLQALGLAAESLSKDISEMVMGEDYEDAVLNYDIRFHRSTGVSKGFMDGQGRLYIVNVKRRA
jgi:hypothetical protein